MVCCAAAPVTATARAAARMTALGAMAGISTIPLSASLVVRTLLADCSPQSHIGATTIVRRRARARCDGLTLVARSQTTCRVAAPETARMNALDRGRVLDFTTTIAGPHCTRLLADLGAEVIKIEAPEGDMMRSRLPIRDGASTSFGQLNAGKKSLVLDLKRPEAVAVVQRLVTS